MLGLNIVAPALGFGRCTSSLALQLTSGKSLQKTFCALFFSDDYMKSIKEWIRRIQLIELIVSTTPHSFVRAQVASVNAAAWCVADAWLSKPTASES